MIAIGPCTLYHADCFDVLPSLKCSAVITDPPYSERTHSGHDATKDIRTGLGYSFWTESNVTRFVSQCHSICSGWIVAMTDHTLAPIWEREFQSSGRYAFAPLPYFAPGSRVRLTGDGPSSWTDWIIVARTKAQIKWGTLPGGYVKQSGWGEHEWMGGKPVGLMNRLVLDYSRPGDVVCDPCMGGGTTAIACINTGRRFIGIERDKAAFDHSVNRLRIRLSQLELMKPGSISSLRQEAFA